MQASACSSGTRWPQRGGGSLKAGLRTSEAPREFRGFGFPGSAGFAHRNSVLNGLAPHSGKCAGSGPPSSLGFGRLSDSPSPDSCTSPRSGGIARQLVLCPQAFPGRLVHVRPALRPAILLARRFPLGSAPFRLLLTLHLVACVVFALIWTLLRAALAVWLTATPFSETFRYAWWRPWWSMCWCTGSSWWPPTRWDSPRIPVAGTPGTGAGAPPHGSPPSGAADAAEPHFLFSALHGISTLMYRDVDAADRMLIRLSELLRAALDRSGGARCSASGRAGVPRPVSGHRQIPVRDHLAVREIDPSVRNPRPEPDPSAAGGERDQARH